MRCTYGDDTVKAVGAATVCEPGADRETAHAVCDKYRGHAGRRLDALDGRFNRGDVAIHRAEHRLERHRNERDVATKIASHPRIPQATIANEAVNENYPASATQLRGEQIRNRVRTKRLLPQKYSRREQYLVSPRRDQLANTGPVRRIVCVRLAKHPELETKDGGIATGKGNRAPKSPSGMSDVHDIRRPHRNGRNQAESHQLLKARQHGFEERESIDIKCDWPNKKASVLRRRPSEIIA